MAEVHRGLWRGNHQYLHSADANISTNLSDAAKVDKEKV